MGCRIHFSHQRIGLRHRFTLTYGLEPSREMGKIFKRLVLLPRHNPRIACDISNRIVRSDQIFPVREAFVKHAIKTVGLIGITVDRVADRLGRSAA